MKYFKVNVWNSIVLAFLLSSYPLLHLYGSNFSIIRIQDVFYPIVVQLLFVTFLGTILIMIDYYIKPLPNKRIIIPLTFIFFFTYGYVYDALDRMSGILFFIGRHRILLILYLAVTVTGIIYISGLKKRGRLGLFIFLVFLNGMSLLQIILQSTSLKSETIRPSESKEIQHSVNKEQTDPDIYFVVLDMYPSQTVLRDVFQYDNSSFLDSCESMGFITYPNSRSNYPHTILSLTSTLNMMHPDYKNMTQDSIDNLMNNNRVVKYLMLKGYQYYIFENGYFSKPSQAGAKFIGINNDNGYSRLSAENDLYLMFLKKFITLPFLDKFDISSSYIYRERINNVFDKFGLIAQNRKKKFVFSHLLSPHPPILFDKRGKPIFHDSNNYDKSLFLGQLSFINTKMLELLNRLVKTNNGRDKVIIVQGDHGSRSLAKNDDISFRQRWVKERFGNLNMIYFSNQEARKKRLKEGYIPSVNTFTALFNNIFKDTLSHKEDLKFFSLTSSPYKTTIIK